MTVFRNEGDFDTSNVEFEGGVLVRYDKQMRTPAMNYIDYGLGVFRREVFEELSASEPMDLASVYQALLTAGQLAGFEIAERFYEIGLVAGIKDTEQYLTSTARKNSSAGLSGGT
jgi:N-acetyl-alpha-D-muramate 1-phosphate uridylyltransferase